jgi:hypothetical protein
MSASQRYERYNTGARRVTRVQACVLDATMNGSIGRQHQATLVATRLKSD